ncbi:MAG TPA: glycosyl hydrolase, partial [Lentisphaeria bacterium]|nr:glycosyl hydrolase [Lentisphaeria bacterium]
MKNTLFLPRLLTALSIAISAMAACAKSAMDQTIWSDRPATDWQQECLPIGNGHLGAMIFGGVSNERIQFNEDSLWIGDETDTGAYQAFGDLYITLKETDPGPKWLRCSSGQMASSERPEQIDMSVDGDVNTKWCVPHGGRPLQWQVKLDQPVVVNQYMLASANDVPARDPKDWHWEGSHDGTTWVLLDQRTEQDPFPKRKHEKAFTFENSTAYRFYRLTLLANNGDPLYQLSEIALNGVSLDATYAIKPATAEAYRRELDIGRAVHTTCYDLRGVTFTREYFASNPADVIVLRLSADKAGCYSGAISLKGAHDGITKAEGNTLSFSGTLSGKYRKPKENYAIRLDYEAQVIVLNQGGRIQATNNTITFEDCDSLVLMLSGDTNYLNRHDKGWTQEHPHQAISQRLANASACSYQDLLQEHIADYHSLFNRLSLQLGQNPASARALDAAERLGAYRGGAHDPELETLIFNYARYLMISCSRPGSLPANLQGLWNQSNEPPWRSDYHSDVNLQMN